MNWYTRRVKLKDGRTMRVLPTGGGGMIIEYGCPCCGHGVQIFPTSYTGKCAWRNKQTEFHHDFIDEIRSKIPI